MGNVFIHQLSKHGSHSSLLPTQSAYLRWDIITSLPRSRLICCHSLRYIQRFTNTLKHVTLPHLSPVSNQTFKTQLEANIPVLIREIIYQCERSQLHSTSHWYGTHHSRIQSHSTRLCVRIQTGTVQEWLGSKDCCSRLTKTRTPTLLA